MLASWVLWEVLVSHCKVQKVVKRIMKIIHKLLLYESVTRNARTPCVCRGGSNEQRGAVLVRAVGKVSFFWI